MLNSPQNTGRSHVENTVRTADAQVREREVDQAKDNPAAGRPRTRGHPARFTQADLDIWHATCRAYWRPAARAFLTWAMDSGHMPRLDLPAIRFGTGEAITQQQRITLLRRYALTDRDPLRVRTAACLMLLYAQPLSRILRLTLTDLGQQPAGPLLLRIGEPPSRVPHPFDGLLLQQARQASLTTSPWLFPGRNPGQPLAYATMFKIARSYGQRQDYPGMLHWLEFAYQTSADSVQYSPSARQMASEAVDHGGPLIRRRARALAGSLGLPL